MVELYSPAGELELSLLKGVLEAEGVTFCVRNDTFGSMEIGPRVRMFNDKCILVAAEDRDRAQEIVAEFVSLDSGDGGSAGYSTFDKVRMIAEAFLFGWFLPGRKGNQAPGDGRSDVG